MFGKLFAVASVAMITSFAGAAQAQQSAPPAPDTSQSAPAPRPAGPGFGFGPGMMMGPGIMGPGIMGFGMTGGRFGDVRGMCSPRMAGFAEWRIDRIERAISPTPAQKKALDDLRTVSAKAAEQMAAACPSEVPANLVARLEAMEKRMTVMLDALKTVRPAFEAFYQTLSDDQKRQLDRAGPRRWGWHRWG